MALVSTRLDDIGGIVSETIRIGEEGKGDSERGEK